MVVDFIREILGYFERDMLSVINLEVEFVDKIDLPGQYIYLQHDCLYDGGCLYLFKDKAGLCFPIKDIFSERIHVKAQRNVSHIEILYLIEKVIMIKAIQKGCPTLHSACLEENGRINIYSGLQGAGKTILALQKLQNGAKFLGEDKVFVDENCRVWCYPRGITLHRYLGEQYYELRRNRGISKSIAKEIWFFRLLKALRVILWVSGYARQRIERAINGSGNLRANVTRLLPETEIIETGYMQDLYVFFKGSQNQLFLRYCDWDSKRLITFLLRNNNLERASHYIEAFIAYGDEYGVVFKQNLNKLVEKERHIITSTVNNLDSINRRQNWKTEESNTNGTNMDS